MKLFAIILQTTGQGGWAQYQGVIMMFFIAILITIIIGRTMRFFRRRKASEAQRSVSDINRVDRKYHYSNGVDRKGPVTLEELRSSGELTAATLVWYEGLPSWIRAEELPLTEVVPMPPLPAETKASNWSRVSAIVIRTVGATVGAGILLAVIVSYAKHNRSGESKSAEPKSSFFTDTGAKYVKKGDQCQESEDYVEAIEWYQKAIDINPKNAAACLGMGHAHLELEKAKLAVKWYQQAIDLKPKYTEEITHTLYFAGLAFYVDDKEGRMLTCLRYAAQLGHRDSQKFLRENDYSW